MLQWSEIDKEGGIVEKWNRLEFSWAGLISDLQEIFLCVTVPQLPIFKIKINIFCVFVSLKPDIFYRDNF